MYFVQTDNDGGDQQQIVTRAVAPSVQHMVGHKLWSVPQHSDRRNDADTTKISARSTTQSRVVDGDSSQWSAVLFQHTDMGDLMDGARSQVHVFQEDLHGAIRNR